MDAQLLRGAIRTLLSPQQPRSSCGVEHRERWVMSPSASSTPSTEGQSSSPSSSATSSLPQVGVDGSPRSSSCTSRGRAATDKAEEQIDLTRDDDDEEPAARCLLFHVDNDAQHQHAATPTAVSACGNEKMHLEDGAAVRMEPTLSATDGSRAAVEQPETMHAAQQEIRGMAQMDDGEEKSAVAPIVRSISLPMRKPSHLARIVQASAPVPRRLARGEVVPAELMLLLLTEYHDQTERLQAYKRLREALLKDERWQRRRSRVSRLSSQAWCHVRRALKGMACAGLLLSALYAYQQAPEWAPAAVSSWQLTSGSSSSFWTTAVGTGAASLPSATGWDAVQITSTAQSIAQQLTDGVGVLQQLTSQTTEQVAEQIRQWL